MVQDSIKTKVATGIASRMTGVRSSLGSQKDASKTNGLAKESPAKKVERPTFGLKRPSTAMQQSNGSLNKPTGIGAGKKTTLKAPSTVESKANDTVSSSKRSGIPVASKLDTGRKPVAKEQEIPITPVKKTGMAQPTSLVNTPSEQSAAMPLVQSSSAIEDTKSDASPVKKEVVAETKEVEAEKPEAK